MTCALTVRAALVSALVGGSVSLMALALPVAQAAATSSCPAPPVLVNGGFEVPATGVPNTDVPAANAGSATPGVGWSTNDPALVLEIWQNGFLGIASDTGGQFVEINATSQDTLTQNVATVPGTRVRWRLAHRGRLGTDTMRLQVGAPAGPLTAQVPDGQSVADISDGTAAWGHYTGVYTVPAGQTSTRMDFAAISQTGPSSYGNFLDSVSLELLPAARDDSASTSPGHSVSVPVLANDCGSTLTVHAIGSVAHGKAVITGSSVTYTPAATFAGIERFSYTVTDASGDSSTALVTVHVSAPAGPSAVAQVSNGDPGMVQVVRPHLAAGDVLRLLDTRGRPVSAVSVPGQGVFAVSGGALTFTPAAGFTGTADVVRYEVVDAFGQSAVSTYTATVLVPLVAGGLPGTGADFAGALVVGLGLVGCGGALLAAGRVGWRRR